MPLSLVHPRPPSNPARKVWDVMSSGLETDDLSKTFIPGTSPSYFAPRPPSTSRYRYVAHALAGEDGDGVVSSPDDGVGKALVIDMKNMIGDAIGNMSISPSYRDVVLAARKGLFIINLSAPDKLPRFLPQGGTWDVADVQWNPHPAREEYVVSTSSEKLLIWNLNLAGPTAIEHVLHAHYRSVTDINWHTVEPNIVVSTGIDSWLWAWDLRAAQKPIMGLSAFNSGGTHVKWNRQNAHILASAHQDEVLIWDRRKGSIPVTKIHAHSAKIYGIDWAHATPSELVTCSLDKTIKVWDIHDSGPSILSYASSPLFLPRRNPSSGTTRLRHPSEPPTLSAQQSLHTPRSTIHTRYPVWRARDLPFGHGLLSLPQRGETALEMFRRNEEVPVEVFEGHEDVVKEFVWRRGGRDWGDFQLITWSKDRTLQFWPVDNAIMARAGQAPGTPVPPRAQGYGARSFHHPPTGPPTPGLKTLLSAPVGKRGILDEVRAQPLLRSQARERHPHRARRHPGSRGMTAATRDSQSFSSKSATTSGTGQSYTSQSSMLASTSGAESATPDATPTQTTAPIAININHPRMQATMTRGHAPGRSARPPEPLQWLSSVRIERPGAREGGSSGTGSGTPSRIGSRSRPASREGARRSSSRGAGAHWDRDDEASANDMPLQEEITSVLRKLAASKIKLEKHDLTRRRTCTMGLNGPWGATSSVFVRVSFAFPKDYPSTASGSNPSVDLEPTPLIPLRTRAHMLRRLRAILETRRPVLEACLRFLLFGDDERPAELDSSSDEESRGARGERSRARGRDATVVMLHSDKNIAEPRTSQGVFGPDGRLVIFGRVPPRIVRNPLNELETSVSPSLSSHPRKDRLDASASASVSNSRSVPRLFKSPALVSDAMRQLAVAAQDTDLSGVSIRAGTETPGSGAGGAENIGDIMASLLFAARGNKARRPSAGASEASGAGAKAYALLQTRLSTVALRDETRVVAPGREMAASYVFLGQPREVCSQNTEIAKRYGRTDHALFFETMRLLLERDGREKGQEKWGARPLVRSAVKELYAELAAEKDVQLLAIFAALLLRMYRPSVPPRTTRHAVRLLSPPSISTTPSVRTPGGDYFALRRRHSRLSPVISTLPSSFGSASLNSSSSRGSWSSLFNAGAGGVRQLLAPAEITGTARDREQSKDAGDNEGGVVSIPVPPGRGAALDSPRKTSSLGGIGSYNSPSRRATLMTESPRTGNSPARGGRTWGSPASSTGPARLGLTFVPSRTAHAPTFSQVLAAKRVPSMRLTIVDLRPELRQQEEHEMDIFTPDFVQQLLAHIAAYAEMLFRWEIPLKRIELLKAIDTNLLAMLDPPLDTGVSTLGVFGLCTHCGSEPPAGHSVCVCSARVSMPMCSICRLPIKGLSYACLGCQHVNHLSCWRSSTIPACATGCGCLCKDDGTKPYLSMSTSPLGIDLMPLPAA